MYRSLRRIGFRFDPERVHLVGLRAYSHWRALRPTSSGGPVAIMGLTFPNVVGLAAGYDKEATAWRGLARVGFGHVEVGTVTPEPQPGSERPRVFRLPADRALINRMGFPSEGAGAVAERLRAGRPRGVVLGVSIGPNGFAGLDQAAADYRTLVDRFAPLADYLAVNVSSPNTAGLRGLESGDDLRLLLQLIVERRDALAPLVGRRVPLVVKLSPDLSATDLVQTVHTVAAAGVDGIVVTNTTTQRPGLSGPTAREAGGLSGRPLRSLSLEVLRRVRASTDLPIIASGGIMNVEDAQERLAAGASLVQLYTGFVYEGPRLVRAIARLTPR